MQTVGVIAMEILALSMRPDTDAEAGIQLWLALAKDGLIGEYLIP